jgi:hypothetical protein
VVLVAGWGGRSIHPPATFTAQFRDGVCPNGLPPGNGNTCQPPDVHGLVALTMGGWFAAAALTAVLVMITPFVVYAIKRRTGRI